MVDTSKNSHVCVPEDGRTFVNLNQEEFFLVGQQLNPNKNKVENVYASRHEIFVRQICSICGRVLDPKSTGETQISQRPPLFEMEYHALRAKLSR